MTEFSGLWRRGDRGRGYFEGVCLNSRKPCRNPSLPKYAGRLIAPEPGNFRFMIKFWNSCFGSGANCLFVVRSGLTFLQISLLAAFTLLTSSCAQSPSIPENASKVDQNRVWKTDIIMLGSAAASIRASSHENVSLNVVCGTDGKEKMLLTFVIENTDPARSNPDNAQSITGLEMPLRLDFGNGASFYVTSTVIAMATIDRVLAFNVIDLAPAIVHEMENNRTLKIQLIEERYRFSLLGADYAIRELKCLR